MKKGEERTLCSFEIRTICEFMAFNVFIDK